MDKKIKKHALIAGFRPFNDYISNNKHYLKYLFYMLARKFRHRYQALLDDNRELSRDATEFSDKVKDLHRDTLHFSEELVAQEQYYFTLIDSPGVDPELIQPFEEQLIEIAVTLSELSKALGRCINNLSQAVCNITDNFCTLVREGRKLESRKLKSKDREELLCAMEKTYYRLKLQYYRYKCEVIEKQEALGKLRLLSQVGLN